MTVEMLRQLAAGINMAPMSQIGSQKGQRDQGVSECPGKELSQSRVKKVVAVAAALI